MKNTCLALNTDDEKDLIIMGNTFINLYYNHMIISMKSVVITVSVVSKWRVHYCLLKNQEMEHECPLTSCGILLYFFAAKKFIILSNHCD